MKFWISLFVICLLSSAASAQDKTMTHKMGMKHDDNMTMTTAPTEGGQSAFAAIQEIVVLLEADPKTDWTKVNIEGLRQHLIDMSNVTLEATVKVNRIGTGIAFEVTGVGAVIASIQRMVAGHVKTMDGVDGWKFASVETKRGATLTVTPPDRNSMIELQALGFIGVMTRGMHHQEHHWMIASGMHPHQ